MSYGCNSQPTTNHNLSLKQKIKSYFCVITENPEVLLPEIDEDSPFTHRNVKFTSPQNHRASTLHLLLRR